MNARALPVPVRRDIADMERILAERDIDLNYLAQNCDTYRPMGALSCGCETDHDCAWHKYVQEALDDAQTIVTSYERTCIPGGCMDWSALRKDYCGCGECKCPVGHGASEEAAIADLYEQESP